MEHKKIMYHQIHCPNCGREFDASELAFDFGKLVDEALEINANLPFGRDETWYDLKQFDLCLYLSKEDLVNKFGFNLDSKVNTFTLTTDKLVEHILSLAGPITPTVEKLLADTDINEYNFLTRNMGKKQEGQDPLALAGPIQDIIQRASDYIGQVIVEFNIEFMKTQDDQHNSYINQLKVTYSNGSKAQVTRAVCKGEPNVPCGQVLNGHAGKYEEIIIGLAGTARVGKTAYLAALLSTITRASIAGSDRLGQDQNVVNYIAFADKQFQEFRRTTLDPYLRSEKILKTDVRAEVVPLFSLSFDISTDKDKNYIFTFVDLPGEVFDPTQESDESFVIEKRAILNYAKMIWFCIDPSQVEGKVVAAANDKINHDIAMAFGNIQNTMQAINQEGKIPTCVLITKSDEKNSIGLYKPDFKIFGNVGEAGNRQEFTPWVDKNGKLYFTTMKKFIKRSFDYVNDKNRGIINEIHDIFGPFSAFAVAPYGKNLDDPAGYEDGLPKPSMIEAPFIWSLAVMGIIPAYEEKTHEVFSKWWIVRFIHKLLGKHTYETVDVRIKFDPNADIDSDKEKRKLFYSETHRDE